MSSWCVKKCVRKCVKPLHTWRVESPRQHWGLESAPSPTTRPPRVRTLWVGAGSRTRGFECGRAGGGGGYVWVGRTQICVQMEGGLGEGSR
jgi:hypothetical protein